ncbi:hypothetical protein BDZ89DRAFT_1121670 [Hymenopellis radicata]|nr:hypothetical protein BDZ89DRAFT_1121670 [Hymenopellis radicata]
MSTGVGVATPPTALGPADIRFKDDPKRLPLLSRIFEWLEAKQPGLGRQIVLKENEVDNANTWKARLIGDNDDIAAQFPSGVRMPHPVEWKSIRPDRDRWGDEEAVEEVYSRLQKNYRKAQRKRKNDSVSRVDDTAARGVLNGAGRASKRLRPEPENSGPPTEFVQHGNTSVVRNDLRRNCQSVFKSGNARPSVVSKESLLVQVANLRKQNTELQAVLAAQEEGQAALHLQCEELQIQNLALETQVASNRLQHQEECAAVRRAADAQVAAERSELDKQRCALQVAKEALAAQVASDRLQHQQDYAALRTENEAGHALVASVLAKCADDRTAMQIEKEALQVQAESDRLQLADLQLRYEAAKEMAASRLVQELSLRDEVGALERDKERVDTQAAFDRAELENRYVALEVEKGRLEAEIASARAQNADMERQYAKLQRQKEEAGARVVSNCVELEERQAALQTEKEAADIELVTTRRVSWKDPEEMSSEDEEDLDLQTELAAVRAHNVALQAMKDDLEVDNMDLQRRNKNLTLVIELLEAAAAP